MYSENFVSISKFFLIYTIIMERNLEILPFFQNSASSVSQSQINNAIEGAYRIAVKYLQLHRLSISKLINGEDLTLQELAMDSIVGLFINEKDNEVMPIIQSFNKWQPCISSEEDCLYFLNKVVASRVEQHIYKLFKEKDPFFSKLLDSVNYLIRTNGFYKFHFLGKTFLSETELEKFEKCFISTDEFEKIPSELFKERKSLLSNLITYLKNETEFNLAIPLNDLIIRLKHVNSSEYLLDEYTSSEFNKIEINEMLEKGFRSAIEKLMYSYVDKGKLDREELNAFRSALKEMAIDLSDGGINPGLYKYLSAYIPGLTEEDYKNKYHNILEYLLKVMKNNIAEELSGNN